MKLYRLPPVPELKWETETIRGRATCRVCGHSFVRDGHRLYYSFEEWQIDCPNCGETNVCYTDDSDHEPFLLYSDEDEA